MILVHPLHAQNVDLATLLGTTQWWYILLLSGSKKEDKTGLYILNKKNRVEHRQSIVSEIEVIKSKQKMSMKHKE